MSLALNNWALTNAFVATDARDLQQIGEAMAMLEADAEAIMQFVSRRHRALANNDESNSPDLPDTPPVHGAVGQTQGQSSNESQGQSEAATGSQQETPMETDKPGQCLNSL